MQWTDEGIVLGVKRHGEANAILDLMTRAQSIMRCVTTVFARGYHPATAQ
ncbi:hypothetical protein DW352_06885 [Pseudolabrys taiwanensis]|uniref:DNA replication/recombination mediator RecO N-terminal domain-containing protein n=1 Tax=Pseudolabrys taiwanensis TaxID=331696 RepID=A0A346A3Z9_9HYPH|nr:hypothetical protein DW352_06885 [Pseudolabrys taiwanensis]